MKSKVLRQMIVILLLFIYPVFSIMYKPFYIGPVLIDFFRFLWIILFIVMLATKQIKVSIKTSKITKALLVYSLFVYARQFVANNFNANVFVSDFFYLSIFFLIENLNWDRNDEILLNKVLRILMICVGFVGLYQLIIDPFFFYFEKTGLLVASFGNTYRIRSLFTGLGIGEGWLYSAFIMVYLTSLNDNNYSRFNRTAYILGMLAVALTQTRSVWMVYLLGSSFIFLRKLHLNAKLLKWIYILSVASILAIGYLLPNFQKTDLYQERVLSRSIAGRSHSFQIFTEHLFPYTNKLIGTGDYNSGQDIYQYGRIHIISVPLNIFLMGGIIGLILYYYIFYRFFKIGSKITRFTTNYFVRDIIIILFIYGLTIGAHRLRGVWFLFVFIVTHIQYNSLENKKCKLT